MEASLHHDSAYSEWQQELLLAIDENEQSFPEGSTNRHTGAIATALRTALHRTDVQDTMRAMYLREDPVIGDNAFQLVVRNILADQLENVGDDTFAGLDDPRRCLEVITEIHEDEIRYEKFYTNLMLRQVQSNIAERYIPVQLLAALMSERFVAPPSYLDIGTSLMHGPKKVVFGNDPSANCPPFHEVDILTNEAQALYTRDPRITTLTNLMLKAQVEFGPVVGTDMTNIDDPVTIKWAETCSLKPYERSHPENIAEFRQLNAVDSEHQRVGYIRADFTDQNDFAAFRAQSPVEKFDIVSVITMRHQISKKSELEALDNHIKEIVSPDGIVIIQDLKDKKTNTRYNYVTEVIDMRCPDKTPQPLIIWENARSKLGAFSTNKIMFGNTEKTLAQAISDFGFI